MRIAVIGGGIAGLTSALALAKQGASVRVFEQASAISEVGAGLQITPNGGRVLGALGVWDELLTKGIRAKAVMPTDAVTGRSIARFDLARFDPGYVFLHRADLVDVLAHAATGAGVEIELNARTDAPPTGFDLIVGAEGIRSPSRKRLNGTGDPFFTGQVAWRALVEHDAAPEARIWMGPGCHVVTYPIRKGLLNVVAVQERDNWAEEGWFHADDPANLRAAFSGMCPDLTGILAKVETTHLWGLFRHDVAARWTNGETVLVGDAAHPTLPFLAQGANLALEDAFALSRFANGGDLRSNLRRYQEIRRPRVLRAIEAANANARNYHLTGARKTIAHLGLRGIGALAPGAFLGRMRWLYEHDVTA